MYFEFLFFFKQKTAYEMRISDWSSDVCSYDLRLFGTEFVFYHGSDLTGRWLDEIADPGFRTELIAMYAGIAASGEMHMLSYDYLLATGPHRFQALALPLSEDGSSRSEEHTSELQSLMRISYAVFCLKKKTKQKYTKISKSST